MVEAQRTLDQPDLAGQDGRVERLLVDGLDQYFAGHYEDAIHIWTRVLFLDRAHARARAYIDRARTAIAERQRRSEELLHASQAHLDRGDTAAARQLLTQISRGNDDERALSLGHQLDRLERARAVYVPPAAPVADHPLVETVPRWSRPMRRALAAVAVVLAIAGATAFLTGSVLPQWVSFGERDAAPVDVAPAELQAPTTADVALIRARTLYGHGRLTEALQALGRVPNDSAQAAEADRLRVEIEGLLLAGTPPHAPAIGIAR